MPANINSMMLARQPAWHGLGRLVDTEQTAENALKLAGLDWTVEKKQAYFQTVKEGQNVWRKMPGQFITVRSDNGQGLGSVGRVYEPLQNRDAFSISDGLIMEKAAVYHTAGALGRGEKVWILAKLDGVCRVNGHDVIDKFLLLSNSHDGSSAVTLCVTPVRVVCQNTLAIALKTADSKFSIRHTAAMGDKIKAAREVLGLSNAFFDDLQEKAAALSRVQVTEKAFDGYLQAIGFQPEAEKGKSKAAVTRLHELFEAGTGQNLPGARGTAWGAYNAVTEYLSHEKPTRVTDTTGAGGVAEARFASNMFGGGQAFGQRAWAKTEGFLTGAFN